MTVLFCDLVGFTARSDRADPEDVKATLRPFHAELKGVIEHYQGTVDKFVGDAVIGVFGAPTSHEDDPERGVRAALSINEAIAELNERNATRRLEARIGLATGEAVVAVGAPAAHDGESVTGDVVTLAARLQSLAPIGGALADDATRRATEELFVWRELDPTGEPSERHRSRSWIPVSARGHFGVDVRPRSSTPFVGRAEELGLLRGAYRRAIRESSVQLVTIIGEPGAGKSRLIGEFFRFIDELPELVRWRQGRCLPYGEGVSFWALGEIVKADADILESDPPGEAHRKLAEAVGAALEDEAERDWLTARLAPLVGIEAETVDREESFAAWRRFLEGLATHSPLVLVFEDLHWADAPMLEFLDHLLDWFTGLPLLVVCAARPEVFERHPGWGGGKRNSTTISLPGLSRAETAMLISALLDRRILPAETHAAILERAGGNPLYAEEFARMLVDRGLMDDGRSAIDANVPIPVPQNIQSLIAARLDTLPPDRKGLLHDAAVIGTVFSAEALAAMGDLDEEQVVEGLHDIVRVELIRPTRTSSAKDQAEYAFWHPLVRDVAYGQIPRTERGAKHRAAAAWIERAKGDRLEDQAELLAHHYGEALELTRSTEAAAARIDLEVRAAGFMRLAGDRSMRLDVEKARRYYERALELLPAGHEDRPRMLVQLAEAGAMAGDFDTSERLFDEAIEAFRSGGDDLGRGEAMAMLARSLHKQGSSGRSRPLLEEAVRILEREPPGPELARAYSRLAGQELISSRYEESATHARKALDLARAMGLDGEIVRSLQFRGASRVELGDDGGLEDLREALRLGLELGLGEETAIAYGNLAFQVWLRDGPAAALELWERCVEFTRSRGFAIQARYSEAGILEVVFDLGDWDRGLELAREMAAWDVQHGDTQVGTFARLHEGWILYHRGVLGEAERLAEQVLPSARSAGYAESLAPAIALMAAIRHRRGDRAEVLDLAREFDDVTREVPDHRAASLPPIARILADLGELELAASLVPERERAPSRRHRLCILTARATIAEAGRDASFALDGYADAARRWGDYGSVLERAQATIGEGRCLNALGRTTEATARLADARESLGRLRALPLLSAVDDLLAEATARSG